MAFRSAKVANPVHFRGAKGDYRAVISRAILSVRQGRQASLERARRCVACGSGLLIVALILICGCNRGNVESTPANDEESRLDFGATKQVASPHNSLGVGIENPVGADAVHEDESADQVANVRLTQVQAEVGLIHTYQTGDSGKALLNETIGGGCGWLDYDCDGRQDLFVNQGGDSTIRDTVDQPLDQLYRNIGGRFDSVTQRARVSERFYSQGVAVGDFDNDGFDDIYVSNLGRNTLWWNCGDGTFMEIGSFAGVDDPSWSTSVAWADLDLDGDLDLYVCNYCQYDPRAPKECKDRNGLDKICNPAELEPWPDTCFFNEGDGSFSEEARNRGLFGEGNRALGVAVADFSGDRLPDIYVANDTTDNFLFVNQGDGSFNDEATLRGCAVDRAGGPQGSMGVAVADVDRNLSLDIYSTHYYEESNTLYANFGDLGFRDITAKAGLHSPTLNFLGFGTVFADLDGDTQLELLVANGHVDHSPGAADPRMRAQLFSRVASGRWLQIGKTAGEYFDRKLMGRGVATCDYDDDGDQDVAVINENDEAILLRNDSSGGNWLKLYFVGVKSNRRGIGCRAKVTAGAFMDIQELCGGTSYAVSHQPAMIFGLGGYEGPIDLEITWPGGNVQRLKTTANRTLLIKE